MTGRREVKIFCLLLSIVLIFFIVNLAEGKVVWQTNKTNKMYSGALEIYPLNFYISARLEK